jgi:hypothetical protein
LTKRPANTGEYREFQDGDVVWKNEEKRVV